MLRKIREKLLSPVSGQLKHLEHKIDRLSDELNNERHSRSEYASLMQTLKDVVLAMHKSKYGICDYNSEQQSPLVSSLARLQDLLTYENWSYETGHKYVHRHRKLWEWAYISQVLLERGMLNPQKQGLGFAVGTEPLPALFAKYGAIITATDLDETNSQSDRWKTNREHSKGLLQLERPNICDKDTFYKNVSFMPVDMNNIPDDLKDFDFCWSSCAFEHLGTVEKGKEFVIDSLKTLKPGGVAVHTTEYNILSEESIDKPYEAVFGKLFFDDLHRTITAQGHFFAPLDYRLGNHPDENYIANPGSSHDHFKLLYGGSVITSIGIIIVKS